MATGSIDDFVSGDVFLLTADKPDNGRDAEDYNNIFKLPPGDDEIRPDELSPVDVIAYTSLEAAEAVALLFNQRGVGRWKPLGFLSLGQLARVLVRLVEQGAVTIRFNPEIGRVYRFPIPDVLVALAHRAGFPNIS